MRLTCVTVELDEALPVFLVHSSSGDRVAELFADLVGVAVLLVDGGLLAGVARDERRISVEPRLAFFKSMVWSSPYMVVTLIFVFKDLISRHFCCHKNICIWFAITVADSNRGHKDI